MPTIRTKKRNIYRTKQGDKVFWDAIPTKRPFEALRKYESELISLGVVSVIVGMPAIMSLVYMNFIMA